jgi:SAM-dependent methyltransferase
MPADLPYPVSPDYRCGTFGDWSLKFKPVETRARGYFTGFGTEPRGYFLENAGECWMSTSVLERESHAYHLKHARGTVVVCGVGMGMYLHNIAARAGVDRIIAVDRDPAVIDLVRQAAGFDEWIGRDKIRFVRKDALQLTPGDLGDGVGADYLYVDIWPEFGNPDAVAQTRMIQDIVGAKAVGWWGQELDFVEWAFQNRKTSRDATADDLAAFIAASGLRIGEPTYTYLEGCRRAAEVYATYGSLPFAAATRLRHRRQSRSAGSR